MKIFIAGFLTGDLKIGLKPQMAQMTQMKTKKSICAICGYGLKPQMTQMTQMKT